MFYLGGKQRWPCAFASVPSGLSANLKLTFRFRVNAYERRAVIKFFPKKKRSAPLGAAGRF